MIVPNRLARTFRPGWALLLVLRIAVPAGADSWRLTVRGSGTDAEATPLVVGLEAPVPKGLYVLIKEPAEPGKPEIAARVFEEDGRSYLETLLPPVAASPPVTYALRPGPGPEPGANIDGILIRPRGPNLEVLISGSPFAGYRVDEGPKPFYYPVFGPAGVAYTRSYPMEKVRGEDQDHPHQRSMWFTHGKVNGIDFWSEMPGHGSIRETSRTTQVTGPALASIRTTDDWLGPDGKNVCEDRRVVRFCNAGKTRLIDFDIRLRATAGPVTFGDTKEGMFGVRVASSMDVKNRTGGKIINAEGLTDDAAWGKASPWVDYTGPVGGETVGIAILNHPESFRYPTTWHVRTYGLFAANPFGWHDFGQKRSGEYTLPEGESIRFRYRVVLHSGTSTDLRQAFETYARPPRVEVEATR